jgi:FixJ family two-component response regulator
MTGSPPVEGITKPCVAIVEDDESVRRAVGRLLHAFGMDADPFSSGDELLRFLTVTPSYRPDCVILDMQMPGVNGLEVQRRLAGSALPIIFITAHEDPAVREQALAAGAVAFLRKPFSDELLMTTVRAALGAGRDDV